MKAKILLAGLLAALCLFSFPGHAQDVDSMLRDTASQILPTHDSAVAPAAGPILPSNNIGGIPVPAWAQTILIALATLLPAIQLVLKRIPTPYNVRIGGILGKILDFLTWFQKDERAGTPLKIALFLLITAALTLPVTAQSVFKGQPHLAKPTAAINGNPYIRATVQTPADSVVNAWRFGVVVPAYAVTPSNTFTNAQAMAGGEFGYKHQTYNYATQSYTTVWSINAAWFALNTATPPTSITGIQTFAVLGGYDNDLIQAGPMYNPQAPKGQKVGLAISIGIALH